MIIEGDLMEFNDIKKSLMELNDKLDDIWRQL